MKIMCVEFNTIAGYLYTRIVSAIMMHTHVHAYITYTTYILHTHMYASNQIWCGQHETKKILKYKCEYTLIISTYVHV